MPIDIGNVSSLAQMAVIVVAAVWSIAKVSSTANVLKALVERMEKQMLRIQTEQTKFDRRLSRVEGRIPHKWDKDSPTGDEDADE